MKFPLMRVLLILVVLAAASLACNLPARGSSAPTAQPPLDAQEMQQLEDQLKATLASSELNSEVTITITQQQLNSLIAAEMANEPNSPIQNPQVVLTGGQMEIYGTVDQAGFSVDSKTIARPGISADGNPSLEVISIQLGPVAAPDALKEQVDTMVDAALQDYLSENANRFKITNIAITEGQMTVTGQRLQP
jgi:hypothetical protein